MPARNGSAKLAGVVGCPISHSLSPALHEYWLATYHINGAYIPIHCESEYFEQTIRSLQHMRFRGVNVTLPHKQAALAIADTADDAAMACNAANTLFFNEQGHIHASNTDVSGLKAHLLASGIDQIPAQQQTALIIGAGGAARAVVECVKQLGFTKFYVTNRTYSKAAQLADAAGISALEWSALPHQLAHTDLLINATSLGMQGQPPLQLDLSPMPKNASVCDIVYKPLTTPLLMQAAAHGLHCIDGLGMLLHQAVGGFSGWYGITPEVTPPLRDYLLSLMS